MRLRPLLGSLKRRLLEGGSARRRFHVFVDTTNGCNLRCSFCTRRTGRLVQMTPEDFSLLLSRVAPHARHLQLCCAWEFSFVPSAVEIVRTLGRFDIPHTTIYSNGKVLGDDLARALIETGVDDYVASFGEARRETYERLRRGGDFDLLVANLRRLVELKRRLGSSRPRLCTNLTLVRSNIEELPDFVDLAASIGVEHIRGRHLILNKGLDLGGEVIADRELGNRLIEEARDRARRHGIDFAVPLFEQTPPPKDCRAPWEWLYVASDGSVSVCARLHRHVVIGNLLRDGLETVLASAERAAICREFEAARWSNPVCETCLANREGEVEIDVGY